MATLWRQDDHFDWFGTYLLDRGLQRQWRIATFVFTVCLAAVPLVMLGSPVGPDTALTRWVAVVAAAGAGSASLVWLFTWPTRRRSIIYNVVCSVCIAATCLSLSNAYGALMGCTVFAVIGGFLAYFHAVGHVLGNLALGTVCLAVAATRLVTSTGDVALTVAAALIVTALNVGIPFGIFSLVHSLRIDLRNSDRDPLTGLLNRRSFSHAVAELLATQPPGLRRRLNVTMVDLDNFKRLNDSQGHAVGDRALVSVAAVLRESCDAGTAIARLGGEEFVIADTQFVARHRAVVERIRQGIASTPFGITASLGTCSAVVAPGDAGEPSALVDRLTELADSAMYRAKRAGGNRVEHHPFGEVDGDG